MIGKHQLTLNNCLAVLEKAKKEFLAVTDKLSDRSSDTLESGDHILVLYYLKAIIILKHLQRPGVVEHMTVSVCVILVCFGKYLPEIVVIN